MRLFASDRIAGMMDKLGFEEGEMIEHKMISNSIERAQKKVEENNFGIRKRLIEYDDVMNKQRNAIYTKRRHALMGERIGMDISNMVWERVTNAFNVCADYEQIKLQFLRTFAMEVPFTAEEYDKKKPDELIESSFEAAMAHFKRKMDAIAQIANPIIKQVFENPNNQYINIMIPITDGKRVYQIGTSLKDAYETEGKSIATSFEKSLLLRIIDDCWKENLRELDELKHSVQNASYEQKDPLLIFKLESVTLFDNMVDSINERTISTLMRAQLPMPEQQEVREAAPEAPRRPQQLRESRSDAPEADPNQRAAATQDTREQVKRREPIKVDKLPGRNDPCPCGSGKKFKQCHGRGL